MKEIYIINAVLVDYRGRIKGKCIKIENDKIVFVGDNPKVIPSNSIIIDAKNRVVMPGLVNAHTHFYSALSHIAVCNEKSFPKILEKLWWKWDRMLSSEDIYVSALLSAVDSVKSGVTCVFDHHASYSSINGSLSIIVKATSEISLRTVVSYEISDRHGKNLRTKAIKENVDFLSFCNNDCRLFGGLIGLHASFTLSNETLSEVSKIVKEYKTGVHVHLLEDEIDRKMSLKKYGGSPVERFEKFQLLNNKSIYAHGVDLNTSEMKRLSDNNCFVVHNPYSNLGNAVGKMPMSQMIAKKIKIGIGTDGFGNDPSLDSRLSSVIHNDSFNKAGLGFNASYIALLKNNTDFASKHFGIKIGKIEKGYHADIVIRDYNPTDCDFNKSELFYKMISAPAETVIVNGKIVRAFNKMLTINEEELSLFAEKISEKLKKKWNKV